MKTKIELEAEYPYPIESVWAVLTDRGALSRWLMETTDFEPRLGRKFQFRAKPQGSWNGIVDCEVVELERPRRLAFFWKGGGAGGDKLGLTKVTFTLESTPLGTRVKLEHGLFEGAGNWFLAKFILGPGWKRMLRKRVLEQLNLVKTGGLKLATGQRIEA